MLALVVLVSSTKARNITRALYPCLVPLDKLKNDTRSYMLPSSLQKTMSAEASRMGLYITPITSGPGLCHYIQTRITLIFARIYGDLPEKEIEMFGNASVNASAPFNLLSLLSAEYLISRAVVIRRRFCQNKGRVFDEKTLQCLSLKSDIEGVKSRGFNGIGITLAAVLGNVFSIIALLLLLVLFSKVKSLHAPQTCIIFLAITQGLFHILQLASLYLYNCAQACTVISIALHWIDLSAFVWLCCTSYEINWILCGKSSFTKQERFTGYGSFAFGLTAIIVLSCTITHFSSGDSIRYGQGRYCIIGNKWSNFYSFVLPISVAFLFSAVWTLYNYMAIVTPLKRSHLRSNEPGSLTRARISVVIRIILLSVVILCTRLLEAFGRSSELAMSICKFLISLQGVAVFIGIAVSKEVLRSVKATRYGKQQDRITFAYKYRKRINLQNNNT